MTSFLRRTIERVGRFVYNATQARYEYANNLKPFSGEKLLSVIERREADAVVTMNRLGQALKAGEIGVNDWRNAVAFELRRGHSQAYALGRGGWQQMTAADRAAVSERLKSEFGYLRTFAQEIADGKLSDAQIKARIDMYTAHMNASYWQGENEAKKAAGYSQERRIMSGAHHCSDCPDYAAQGWQPIGSLPMPGDSCECRSNCLCTMEYR